MTDLGGTVDPRDIARFAAQSDSWWDPEGSFAPLHKINPPRLDFVRQQALHHFGCDARSLRPFTGHRLADVGCGGGLVAEPMARLGFAVTGIDATAESIAVARDHAEASGLAIDYRIGNVETTAAAGEQFDIVLALEIIEHVADRDAFLAGIARLVAPGGLFIGATLNRTPLAFATAIVGAEYILRWLPRGTHDWRQFVRPSEFALGLRRRGLRPLRLTGLSYDPLRAAWSLSQDLSVNYLIAAAAG
ncbi:MAG: bifunctional 2-polyprenyl-6-hydroxyphenol methylase/3-demethylubiquinol 3-O-methyltransferase UbiG [Alphaproteobacteria bacterium]|nr:bifunctional 2-polyprenyl-6-hydroxyphenol methylase/3-demethylubiquinol 3-O-methyltransferase UbiG [Alphaproteobacteria bacterium]